VGCFILPHPVDYCNDAAGVRRHVSEHVNIVCRNCESVSSAVVLSFS